MDPGLIALVSIFALAAVFALWKVLHSRSIERGLAAKGFEPCHAEASSLEATWRALTGGDASQEQRLVNCRRRGGGRGAMYHFTVRERPAERSSDDTGNPWSSYPSYLFDLRDPASMSRGRVTLHILPPGSVVMRKLLAGVIGIGETRPRLDVGTHPWSSSIVAAHGDAAGKLDDVVPAAVQQKLVRATEHGFFVIYLGDGKAGFVALPNHRDVDAQLSYLREWA